MPRIKFDLLSQEQLRILTTATKLDVRTIKRAYNGGATGRANAHLIREACIRHGVKMPAQFAALSSAV